MGYMTTWPQRDDDRRRVEISDEVEEYIERKRHFQQQADQFWDAFDKIDEINQIEENRNFARHAARSLKRLRLAHLKNYEVTPEHAPHRPKDEAELDLARARRLYERGLPVSKIAEALGISWRRADDIRIRDKWERRNMITVYTMPNCTKCAEVKKKLLRSGIEFFTADLEPSQDTDVMAQLAMQDMKAPVIRERLADGTEDWIDPDQGVDARIASHG